MSNENRKSPRRQRTLIPIKYGAPLETGEGYCARAENEEWTHSHGCAPIPISLKHKPSIVLFLLSIKVK